MNRRNVILNLVGEGLWGFQAAMVASATVLTVFLQDFGAGPRMIGAIPAIETGGVLMFQVFGLRLFTSRPKRKRGLVLWHLLTVIPFLFLIGLLAAVSPHLPAAVVRWTALAMFGCSACAIGVIVAVWMDWMATLYGGTIRGTIIGVLWSTSALFGALGGVVAGQVLKRFHAPESYAALFITAGLIAVAGILMFLFLDEPQTVEAKVGPALKAADILKSIRTSLDDANFLSFLWGRMLATAGFCIVPFIAVHYTSAAGGGLSAGQVVSYGAAMSVGAALSSLGLGRLGDQRGHRIGLIIGVVAQVAALAALLIAKGPSSCLFVYTMTGICWGSGNVSHYNALLESCRHDDRVAHITLGNVSIGLVAVIAPLLGGVTAARGGMPMLFGVSLGLSLVALVWHVLFFREPREDPTRIVASH